MAVTLKIPVSAARPATGPLSQMVGASAISQIAQLQRGGVSIARLPILTGEAIAALQDQINSINSLLKLLQQIASTVVPVYANNAAAIAGGLAVGAPYRTGADPDPLCIVH